MSLDLATLPGPIDPTDPKYLSLLAHLQGNILKSHGRNRTINLFLTFAPDTETEVENWIGAFTRRFVTSALRQINESIEFKTNGLSGRIFATLSLSAAGYSFLNRDLSAFVEKKTPGLSTNVRFTAGIRAARPELNDPPIETWEINGPDTEIHALVLLADEDETRLNDVLQIVIDDLDERGILAEMEIVEGRGLRDKNNQPLEHFGYRDGISQPLFFVQEVEEERGRFGTSAWDPSASLTLVLVPDPFAPAPESFGSYFVFRKLEQNVAAFKAREKALADQLTTFVEANGLPAFNEERAGALAVGRFENGIPVELTGSDQAVQFRDVNDFNYHTDAPPARCPFHGHIRKTNPRGDTRRVTLPSLGIPASDATDEQERGRRIARRGITFGERVLNEAGQLVPPVLNDDGTLDPPVEGAVGLLFQCYQASIPDQFGFMQHSWANNPDFPKQNVGIDPIIGQGEAPILDQQWPPVYGDAGQPQASSFSGFVTMRGGEFFFTPSIPFLLTFGLDNPSVRADTEEIERRALPNMLSH